MGRNRGKLCGRFEGADDDRAGSRPGWPVRVTVLSWAGVIPLTLLVCVVVLLARDSRTGQSEQLSRSRIRRLPSSVGAMAFAPEGRTLALGYSDGSLEVRDLERGGPREIEPSVGASLTRCVAFSPDGRTLASGGRGSGVTLWEMPSGKFRGTLEDLSTTVGSLAFSPDGQTLATGSVDGLVQLWDSGSGREIARMAGHSGEVRSLAFAPDGKTLASGSFDRSVKLWDVASGRKLDGVDGQGRRVYSLAYAPDGKSLAISFGATYESIKGLVVVWDLAGGSRSVRVMGEASFASVAFAPDGKTLAAAGGDRVVKLWDVATGRPRPSLTGHEGFIASLAYSPDGQLLATAGRDARLGLFELGPEATKLAPHRL